MVYEIAMVAIRNPKFPFVFDLCQEIYPRGPFVHFDIFVDSYQLYQNAIVRHP